MQLNNNPHQTYFTINITTVTTTIIHPYLHQTHNQAINGASTFPDIVHKRRNQQNERKPPQPK